MPEEEDFDSQKFVELLTQRIFELSKIFAPGQHSRYAHYQIGDGSGKVWYTAYYSNRLEHGIPSPGRNEKYHRGKKVFVRKLKPRPGNRFLERAQEETYKELKEIAEKCLL